MWHESDVGTRLSSSSTGGIHDRGVTFLPEPNTFLKVQPLLAVMATEVTDILRQASTPGLHVNIPADPVEATSPRMQRNVMLLMVTLASR